MGKKAAVSNDGFGETRWVNFYTQFVFPIAHQNRIAPKSIGVHAAFSADIENAHHQHIALGLEDVGGEKVVSPITVAKTFADLNTVYPGDIIIIYLVERDVVRIAFKTRRHIKGFAKPYRSVVVFQACIFP